VFGCDGAPQGPLMQRCPGHAEGMTDPSVHRGATELGRFLRARQCQGDCGSGRQSPEFASLWRRYDVRGHTRGHRFHHAEVGDLTLGYQSMTLNGTTGQAVIAYYAEPAPLSCD